MEPNQSNTKSWRRTHGFLLALILLLLCIGGAYLARDRFQAGAVKAGVEKPKITPASNVITLEKLKQESDRQVAPLLAQLKDSPGDPILLAEIGKLYYQMRRFSMAANYYEQSVHVKPDPVVLVKLGGAYHYTGEDEKAIEAWKKVLNLDPNNPDALFNIGYVQMSTLGDPEAAIAAWRKLLRSNPNHPKRVQVEELIERAKHSESPAGK